jgi:hypothetical protein
MPRFCVVVKSANEALYQALEEAFLGRTGFAVIRERREHPREQPPSGDRRKARVWETGALAFAEYEE